MPKLIQKLRTFFHKKSFTKKRRLVLVFLISLLVVAAVSLIILSNKTEIKIPKHPKLHFSTSSPNAIYVHNNDKSVILNFRNSGSPLNIKNAAKKEIHKYLSIKPTIKGSWTWLNSKRLEFIADEEFIPDTKYEVKISQDFFGEKIEMLDKKQNFITQALHCIVDDEDFYINPIDFSETRVTATLNCNYPVARNSIRDAVSLSVVGQNVGLKFLPSDNVKSIDVSSDVVKIDEKKHYSTLNIKKNALKGVYKSTLTHDIQSQVVVPSIDTIFDINNISTSIIRKDDKLKTPQQALIIETTLPVQPKLLQEKLEVYLLPQGYWSLDSVKRRLKKTSDFFQDSKRLDLSHLSSSIDDNNHNSNIFTYDTKRNDSVYSSHYLYIKIKSGLKTKHGYVIKREYERVFRAPTYPKELSIIGEGSVLNLKGDKKLSFFSRGIKDVDISVKRILPRQLNHLITQTNGNIKNLSFKNYNFGFDNISESFKDTIKFANSDPKKINYSFIDFNKYIKAGRGIFMLKIRSKDHGFQDNRFIVISDIGILVKKQANNISELFVTSISGEKPLKNAKVEVLGKNGVALLTKYSNSTGKVQIADLSSYHNEKQPVAYVVTKNSDVSFLPYKNYHNLNYSSFNVGGEHSRYANKDKVKAFILSDRGIYRPGDTVNLATILKKKSFEPLIGLPLEVEIIDPKNKKTFKEAFTLPKGGISDFKYKTSYTSLTGTYKFYVYLIKEVGRHRSRTLLGSKEFLVEEFQPDKIKIKSDILKVKSTGWNVLKDLQAKVKIENMFGLPAQDNLVKADLTISPTSFNNRKYQDYTFDNPLKESDNKTNRLIKTTLPEQRTNDKGEAIFDLDLSGIDKGFYSLSLFSEGFDDSDGKSVKSISQTYVSSYKNLLGYKSNGNLNYVKMGSKKFLNFIAINHKLAQIDLQSLKAVLIEKKTVSTLIKDKNGRYSYQSVEKKEIINEKPFSVGIKGSKLDIKTDKAGTYSLMIKDEEGNILSNISYYVAGGENLDFALENNNNLQLKLNKSEYSNGESIELNIRSPYKGYGLITIEKDKVYAHKWFKTSSNNTTQTIKLPKEIESNAYINVSFIRSLKSKEIYTNPLSYAVAPFNINKSKREIKIDLDVADINKPNQDISVKYKTSKPSKIIIFGVDEGILQVTKYKNPDPLNFFLKKQALEVSTSQILDLLLPEYSVIQSISSPSGGHLSMMQEALKRNLNPFKRKTLKPMVFWSGILEANAIEKEITFKSPSYFNGQVRLIAVAVNDFALGSTSKDTIIRSPIIISPSAPFNVSPGDEFDVNVSITNNIENNDHEQDVINLNIETSKAIKIIGSSTQQVTLNKKSEKKITLKAKVLDKLGAGYVKINADTQDKINASSYESTLSVRPKTIYKTTITSNSTTNKEENITLTRDIHDEFSNINLAISSNPIIFAKNLGTFLQKYPHGCSEQLTSRLFSFLSLVKFGDHFVDSKEARASYNATINKLRSRQNSSGGISLWPGRDVDNDFVSIYVAHLLTEAGELYYHVPRDMKRDLMRWMESFLEKNPSSLKEARLQTYAAYILTRNGKIVTPKLVSLEGYIKHKYKSKKSKSDISFAYLASSYQLLLDHNSAGKLIKRYSFPSESFRRGYHYYDNSLSYDAQYLYMLAKHFPDKARKQVNSEQIKQFISPILKQRYSTLSAGYTILALSNFSDNKLSDISLKAQAKDKKGADLKINTQDLFNIALSSDTKKVSFKNGGKKLLFYSLLTQAFDKTSGNTDQNEKGNIQISKNYLDKNGDETTTINVGDEVEVSIKIRLFETDDIYSSVIIDLLPGGFEIVPNSLIVSNLNFHEKREDRNLFYTSLSNGLEKEITYKIKALNSGVFNIPATTASDMYDSSINGRSDVDKKITVNAL